MATFPYAASFPDGVAYPQIPLGSTTVNVSTSTQLTTALSNATAGQRIVLANGTYSGAFSVTSKAGTSSAGISIEAASTGGAVFASGSTWVINNSAYVTLRGLSFPYELTSGNVVAFRGTTHHSRITRCLFGPTAVGTPGANKTPFIFGSDSVEFIRVDHSELRNKANPGNTILFDGNFTTLQACKHIRIDHCYIHDIRPELANEKEPIRLGVSTMSKTASNSVIERCRFEACICEPEVISVKAGSVRVTGNVVYRSIGGIVYRHGTNGVVNDNYIVDRVNTFGTTIGSGGFRGYDANHEFAYNYVDSIYGGNFQNALTLDSGDQEGSSTTLDGHWRVVNWLVERNVLVGNPTGIVFGHNYSLAPTGCTVRDNLVAQAASGTAITQKIAPVSTTISSNLYGSTPGALGLAQGGDTIWRTANYGPRLTYLQPADVGVTGDASDADGTGVLVGSNGGGGGSTTPADPTSAADVRGWGAPLSSSDEFNYTGSPNSSKWGVYNGPGHAGNGQRLPARVTVDGAKLVGTGLANGDSFGMEHKLDQQYGRWEVRMRAYPTGTTSSGQTRGVGGVATPSGAILATSDQAGTALTITTSGTSNNPRVYDGQGHAIGRVTFDNCQYVVVQNYRIQSGNQYGVVFDGATNCTLQNCDISNVRNSGDGDLNAITVWGGTNNKINYNTAVNYIGGTVPSGSHTDVIQTWVSSSHPNAATNYQIIGNRFVGPANPSRDQSIASIHQCIMVEGAGHGGNSGGSGNPSGWLVADNEFGDSWNQCVKLDGGDNFTFTRNNFAGSSDKVFDLPSASGYKVYEDNQFGSAYGSIGATITPGSGPATPGGSGGTVSGNTYHPVMIVWPTSDQWPQDGEYDFVELDTPGQQSLVAFMHYPHDASASVQQIQFSKAGVDTSQFHNYGFEWTPDFVKGYVDGVEWFTAAGGATSIRRAMQTMPSGHLTIQLDNFDGTNQVPATMEVEWARVYTLTPSGGGSGPQTVSPSGITSREAFGLPAVTIPDAPAPANSVPTILGQNLVLGTGTLGYTIAGGPGPSGGLVVRPAGIPSGQAFGRPSFDVPPGDQVVSVTGIPPVTAFGRPTFTGGRAPDPAPGGVLVPALFAVGQDGITLTPLPAWVKMHLSPVRNSAGSLSIDYPSGAPGFDLLYSSVSASPLKALEIRVWLGGNNTAALGGWLVQKSGDSLTPGSIWTFSGHFHEWLLSKAIVAPQEISEANKSGALTFAGATSGLILATVMDQAQARGALPLVTRDFTTTHDSNGQPWSKAISSVKFAPKTTVAQIADKLVELGMCEYELTPGRMFRAYNPEGRGADRSTGLSPVSFAHTVNLKERAQRESSRDAGTAVLVAGSEGFYSWASSATAQSQLGWRAEVGADAGQLNSQAAVTAVAPTYLATSSSGTAEYSASIVVGPGHQLPLIDYGVGDWALVRTGTRYERQRIAQIELDFEPGTPPSGSVEFNDLITDRLTALYKRLAAISTGDAVVGTSESTPGGAGEDRIPPAAPRGLTVVSIDAYQQPGESETYSLVDAGWEVVTTNAYPDAATADKSSVAGQVGARLAAGQTVFEDWTWSGAPALVGTYNDVLLEEWKTAPTNPGGTGNTLGTQARDWLLDYATTHQGGGAITDDVEKYRVQWRYLGSQVVPSRQDPGNGVPGEPQPPRDPNAFPDDAAWFEPGESPTTTNRIEFGSALAGRAITVRVSAVDRSGNQGPWCTPVSIVTAIDNQPPPAPSKPVATAWFRTMDITWDGKGSSGEDMFAAAPDVAGGGLVEVHVDTGIDFTPDRPLGANGKVDLALSRTYRAALYDAGTWNETNLVIGTTYYARLVAVDKSGNASEPSETSDGVLPQQLVNIDIGPNAIARAQIIDGEIVRAKIADLAVNSAKVEEISVGKLTAGTITAQMTLSGRFSTPVSATGHQVQFDSAGIRMLRSGTVIGRWETFDGSMLVTGQTQTAVTGQRIVMNPGGGNPDTMRFYPTSTDVYSSIDSVSFGGGTLAGIRIVGSGTTATANRGMVLVRDQYASLVHGRSDLSSWGSEVWIEPNFTRNKSATVDLIIDERITPLSGERRVAMIHYNTAGQPINATGLYYKKTAFNGGEPQLYANGQDCALIFAPDGLKIRNNPNGDWRDIWYANAHQMSGRATKRDIHDLDLDPLQTLRTVGAKRYRLRRDSDDAPERMGFIAEDMPRPIRVTSSSPATEEGEPPLVAEAIDYSALTTLLWAATKKIDERLAALEDRPGCRSTAWRTAPDDGDREAW